MTRVLRSESAARYATAMTETTVQRFELAVGEDGEHLLIGTYDTRELALQALGQWVYEDPRVAYPQIVAVQS
jgi:hypothetical protein